MRIGFLGNKNHCLLLISQIKKYHPEIKTAYCPPLRFYRLFLYDIVHIIFPAINIWQMIGLKLLKLLNKKIIFHWIGSDILNLSRHQQARIILSKIKDTIDCHVTQSKELQNELSTYDITAQIIHILTEEVVPTETPFPKKFTVLSYIPEGRENFYGYSVITRLVNELPDISFLVSSNSGKGLENHPNLHYLGRVASADKLLDQASCLLRYVQHDGLGKMIIEALGKGRHVIWIYEFPFCHKATSYNEVKTIINRLKTENSINKGASQFVRENFSLKVIIERWIKLYHQLLTVKK